MDASRARRSRRVSWYHRARKLVKQILDLYGEEAGQHVRSAVGMAELPFGIPVEIEAEVEIRV